MLCIENVISVKFVRGGIILHDRIDVISNYATEKTKKKHTMYDYD